MRLTMHTDYALRVLMFLGLRPGGLSSIREIAQAYQISENHLVKVVHRLGRTGMVETVRGRGGGLRLAVPPGKIRLGDVVRLTEESLAPVECFTARGEPEPRPGGGPADGGPAGCVIAGPCGLQRVLHEALRAYMAVLDRATLGDLLGGRCGALAGRLGVALAPGVPDAPAAGGAAGPAG